MISKNFKVISCVLINPSTYIPLGVENKGLRFSITRVTISKQSVGRTKWKN